jgi:hypothetical protein
MEKNINLYDKNNKLIAEFLGLNIITDGISLFDTNYKPLAKYHESWNDLMPVVEKVCDIIDILIDLVDEETDEDYNETLTDFYCMFNEVSFFPFQNTRESIYENCLQFIEWYNDNK